MMPLVQPTLMLSALVVCSLPVIHASDVARLNRVTFTGNALASREGEGPEGWVVLFCAEWYEPCQQFQNTFLSAADEHGKTSDDNLFSRTTRFAEVDCAIDKVLCNSQDVDVYPTVVHYRGGGRASEWSQSGRSPDKEAKSFTTWLKKQMEKPSKPFGIATTDVGSSAERPATVKFGLGAPLQQSLPMLVAMVAGTLSVCRFGSEVYQGLQLLREVPGERRASMHGKDKPASLEPLKEAPADPLPAVVRVLPETWARQTSVEL